MSSYKDSKKPPSSSPNKSKANFRGRYHKPNAPYPKNSYSGSRSRRDSRHFPTKFEQPDDNQMGSELPGMEMNSDVVGIISGKQRKRQFTGRCNIFVGNNPNDVNEDEFKKLFEPFGETREVRLAQGRGCGFVKLETRHKAEDAVAELDGMMTKSGRNLRVRHAGNNAVLRVKYLPQHVSDEMLGSTFSYFGEVERAIVVVDDKGKSTGEGIVEFERRSYAMAALKKISKYGFLMTSQLGPIAIEMEEQNDDKGGLPKVFHKAREIPPRFAVPGSFEADVWQKWMKLYQLFKEQEELLKRNFAEEVAKLGAHLETAHMELHTLMLRQDIQRMQEELRMLEEQIQNEIKRKLEIRWQDVDSRGCHMLDQDLRRRSDGSLGRQAGGAKSSPSDPFFPMGALNLLGSLGGPPAMGGNMRMGLLRRPPILAANHPTDSIPLRPSQGMRFDAPQGFRPAGGNLFGLHPPNKYGTGPPSGVLGCS